MVRSNLKITFCWSPFCEGSVTKLSTVFKFKLSETGEVTEESEKNRSASSICRFGGLLSLECPETKVNGVSEDIPVMADSNNLLKPTKINFCEIIGIKKDF